MNRQELQTLLVRRCGNLLTAAKMSAKTEGDNPDMADPILWALRMLGYTPASVIVVSDLELAFVADIHISALLDLAELQLLSNIQGNYARVSSSTGSSVGPTISESWGQLLSQISDMVKEKRAYVDAMHSDLLAIPLSGTGKRMARVETI